MPSGKLAGSEPACGRESWRYDHFRVAARYNSGGGWPALHRVSRFVGAKNVVTTAVAKLPAWAIDENCSLSDLTNRDWSRWLTYCRMSERSCTAASDTAWPWPLTSA